MEIVKSLFHKKPTNQSKRPKGLTLILNRFFLNDKNILWLILFNALLIFLSGFDLSPTNNYIIDILDNIVTGMFIAELLIKFNAFGLKKYFSSNWNKFDFTLIIISLPAFISFISNVEISDMSFLLVFRVMRVFKSFRFLKFIPGIEHLINGIKRALKASVFVLIGFVIYIFIVGTFSFHLFKESSPEFFSNPMLSLYSIFKIFTLEAWSDMPVNVTSGFSPFYTVVTYFYFIFILLTGGIFGLSLVNSIFVDAMVSDNNDDLEKKIDKLDKKIEELIALNKNSETHQTKDKIIGEIPVKPTNQV